MDEMFNGFGGMDRGTGSAGRANEKARLMEELERQRKKKKGKASIGKKRPSEEEEDLEEEEE